MHCECFHYQLMNLNRVIQVYHLLVSWQSTYAWRAVTGGAIIDVSVFHTTDVAFFSLLTLPQMRYWMFSLKVGHDHCKLRFLGVTRNLKCVHVLRAPSEAYADWANKVQQTNRPGKCNDREPLRKSKARPEGSRTDKTETTTYGTKHLTNIRQMS